MKINKIILDRRQTLKLLGHSCLAQILWACQGGETIDAENVDTPSNNADPNPIGGMDNPMGGMDNPMGGMDNTMIPEGPILTPNDPGMWADKIAGHYPITMVEGNTVTVMVAHPMDADHYISLIYLKDENDNVLGMTELMAGSEAYATFEIMDASIAFNAYAVCNLHETWVAPPIRDRNYPGPWADKIEGHTPVVTFGLDTATVTVPHPMTDEHYIVAIYISDQTGKVIAKKQLDPINNPNAIYTFDLPQGTSSVTPWALCDDHDLWIGETKDVVDVSQNITTWEAEGVLTPNDPGMWADKIAGHYPIALVDGNQVKVTVAHPMDEDHYISAIYLKDTEGNLLDYRGFVAGQKPNVTFELTDPSAEFTVYAACNLHQVWSAPAVRSADRPGPWVEKVASHTPVAELNEDASAVTVTVTHPMDDEHYIVALYLSDENGYVFAKKQLTPAEYPEATYTFELNGEASYITAWSLCDDHDLWIGNTVNL